MSQQNSTILETILGCIFILGILFLVAGVLSLVLVYFLGLILVITSPIWLPLIILIWLLT